MTLRWMYTLCLLCVRKFLFGHRAIGWQCNRTMTWPSETYPLETLWYSDRSLACAALARASIERTVRLVGDMARRVPPPGSRGRLRHTSWVGWPLPEPATTNTVDVRKPELIERLRVNWVIELLADWLVKRRAKSLSKLRIEWLIYSMNNQQMQLYAVNFIPLLGSLYMFRVFYTPIIRSTIFKLYLQPLVRTIVSSQLLTPSVACRPRWE